MNAFRRKRGVIGVAGLGTICLLLAGRIALHSYRGVMDDFEPAPYTPALEHPERSGISGLGNVAFESKGRVIRGWYSPSRNRAAVVLVHGTNADRTQLLPEARFLAAAGFGVLIFDWPGQGASDGREEWGAEERAALDAAVGFLGTQTEVDQGRIGGFGFSMGGYTMAQVAAVDTRLRAIVLASAPSSFVEYTRAMHGRWGYLTELPANWALRKQGMMHEQLRPIDLVARIAPRPLLVLGGGRDRYIRPSMDTALYARAGQPKSLWIIPNAGHGGYERMDPQHYPNRITSFFSNALLQ